MKLTLIGCGCGPDSLSAEARRAIEGAELLVGSPRLLEQFPGASQRIAARSGGEIEDALRRSDAQSAALLFSGDSGFYSGAAGVLERAEGAEIKVLPGLSSVQVLAARLKEPWQDWRLCSAHGRDCDAVDAVCGGRTVFFLTGGRRGPAALCRERDIVLMFDEVQVGNGRSGALYAYMNFGVEPDVVSTAKGQAGGLPLGATLLGEKVQNVLGYGDHGSTFGGNPVCCAGAVNVLSRIDEELLAGVREKSKAVFAALEGAPGIESVTGMGLMIGVKTKKPAGDVVNACIQKGVLCLTAADKVRLLPALNIPMEQLMAAIEVIKQAAAE